MVRIVIGSTVKGLIAGNPDRLFRAQGEFAGVGIVFGLGVGLLLAYGVCVMQPGPDHYYFEIMLPGGIVGTIIGYATQRFGQQPRAIAD